MASWSAFYPLLLDAAPSAPDPVLDQALLGASREFYDRTRLWRPWFLVTTADLTRQYDLPVQADADMVRLEQATLNGKPYSILRADAFGLDLAVQEGDEAGLVAVAADLKKITLVRAVPDASQIRVQASLQPSETATGVADPDWAQYARQIAAGAKAILLAQSDRPWTDLTGAGLARATFEVAINDGCYRRHLGAANTVPRKRLRLV
jgi:hypothetical protein